MSDTRRVVIGTAGHVDHGKTALVRALTGVETDRWEEEKRRGITIDLGFAPWALGDDVEASIVDVPGHEDFVRNMVAGATGIDVVLLVIASDEGIMPQTEEHLAIVEFLDVRSGVVAITKSDLAEPEWLELVHQDVAARLEKTGVAWHGIVPVSSVAGTGLRDLREALVAATRVVRGRDASDLFRLPVDRVFSVAGAGTVVTGTTWSGTAHVGDEVLVLPGEHRARVRSIEVHGQAREAADPGRRTALGLSGIARDAVARGSCVVDSGGWRETRRVDVQLDLLPGAAPITGRSRVRVHLGTAEVLARVTPAAERVAAGGHGAVRLRLERPVVARHGDRLVIRSYSPAATIGGAVVVDPGPAERPRRPRDAGALLDAAADVRVRELVIRSGKDGVLVRDLPLRMAVGPAQLDTVTNALVREGMALAGGRLYAASEVGAVRAAMVKALERHHQRDKLAPGFALEELRQVGGRPDLAAHVEAELVRDGTITLDAGVARLSTHQPGLGPEFSAVGDRVRNALRDAGFEGRTAAELSESNGEHAARVAEFYVRQGTAKRLGKDRYYDTEMLDRMVRIAGEEVSRLGEVSPAQLREKLGLTRKYLIPFLEWLDREGYTTRVGDKRTAGPRLTKGSAGI